jgi:hypothetical protein
MSSSELIAVSNTEKYLLKNTLAFDNKAVISGSDQDILNESGKRGNRLILIIHLNHPDFRDV